MTEQLVTTNEAIDMDSNEALKQDSIAQDSPTASNDGRPKIDIKKLAKKAELFLAFGLIFVMAAIFVIGRIYWDERYYVAEEGLGYWLGLVGGVMMLFALLYGLFKHVPALRAITGMKRWLQVHIFFGVVGPLLVVFHTTFQLGSLNGTIAFFAMVMVYLSGIIGRFLYSKIHYGLGGTKAKLGDVKESLVTSGRRIKSNRLDRFTESVMAHPASFIGAWWDLMAFGWRSRWLTFQLRRDMKRKLTSMAKREGWEQGKMHQHRKAFRQQLKNYMFMLRKVALFSVYERFFSFWRHAHVPLLYLLLFSGILHVIAVHMY